MPAPLALLQPAVTPQTEAPVRLSGGGAQRLDAPAERPARQKSKTDQDKTDEFSAFLTPANDSKPANDTRTKVTLTLSRKPIANEATPQSSDVSDSTTVAETAELPSVAGSAAAASLSIEFTDHSQPASAVPEVQLRSVDGLIEAGTVSETPVDDHNVPAAASAADIPDVPATTENIAGSRSNGEAALQSSALRPQRRAEALGHVTTAPSDGTSSEVADTNTATEDAPPVHKPDAAAVAVQTPAQHQLPGSTKDAARSGRPSVKPPATVDKSGTAEHGGESRIDDFKPVHNTPNQLPGETQFAQYEDESKIQDRESGRASQGSRVQGGEFRVEDSDSRAESRQPADAPAVSHSGLWTPDARPPAGGPSDAAIPQIADPREFSQAVQVQVDPQIVSRAQRLQPGETTRLQIRLNPPELGRVTVDLTSSHDGLTVRITAPDEAARAALLNDSQHLKNSLADSGIHVLDFDVTPDGGDQRQRWQSPTDQDVPRIAAAPRAGRENTSPASGRRLVASGNSQQIDLIV